MTFLLLSFYSFGQEVWLHPNVGQWDEEIEYAVDLNSGYLYVDQKGFTYFLNDALSHDHDHKEEHDEAKTIHCQVVKVQFENSSWQGEKIEGDPSSFYRNYFIGNDQAKWKSGVKSYRLSRMKDFYPGIDMILDGSQPKLKYSFEVKPGKDASSIQYTIEGSDKVFLKDGSLHYTTRFGEISEEKPIAWTIKDGKKKEVEVEFALEGNIVHFEFPNDYDHTATLIIDPYLVFSTFSGSTVDNWGMTATPDEVGNLHGGGIVFALAGLYPTTPGVFDASFNGGNSYTYTQNGNTYSMSGFDIAISKFNSTGSSLLFSTYMGGSGNEAPHSMVCDENNNLYVFGVTSSVNFPVTAGCFDPSFNGGPTIAENELGYQGADLYVSRFNAAGTALIGSTYVGGTGTDGVNIGSLNYNYGDSFRGEIIVKNGSVYVSSTTQSTDFPTVGAAQNSLNGVQDAVVFKMNNNLTIMNWSTYFGGSGLETGNSLQLSTTGNLFVAGGTTSSTIPVPLGQDLLFDGVSDGYVLKINGTSSTFMSGTFMGLGEYDQAYFVQLDASNDVYVYGQTESAWTISPGLYGNPNSGQFIRKYNNNLTSVLWTTMIGAGTGHPEISPTAFLVSDCSDIYITGWGGFINVNYSNQAQFSTSSGFPVTADAYEHLTNGSNFYLAVLSQNAATLKYATYMGGSASSYNHVDGGTSRFDKKGQIYHAVCGACGGNDNGFTSTPGVWSPTNQSTNCNLAAFKFDLNPILAVIPDFEPFICFPEPVAFTNTSINGNTYYWDFDDGTFSTEENPTHSFPQPGTYVVTLIVSDANSCYIPDTVDFEVNIGDFQGGVITPATPICLGESYQLEAMGGANYLWSPADVLDDPTSPMPIATIPQTTTFTVVISDSCGTDTLSVTLFVYDDNATISNDTSVCIGNSVMLNATGGGTYVWTPEATLSDPSISNPIATPTTDTEYFLEVTSVNGCVNYDSVTVSVFFDPPVPVMPGNIELCMGATAEISVSGADTYVWSPDYQIDTLAGSFVNVNPEVDFTYYCNFINACGNAVDSVIIDIVTANIFAGNDTIICPGETATIWATGGVIYYWTPTEGISNPNVSSLTVTPVQATLYHVLGTDANGCTDTASVFVDLFPQPFIQTSPNVNAIIGDEIQLSAESTTTGPYIWSPAEYLSCVSCPNPIASPDIPMIYTVTYTDENGCTASDQVSITYDPIVYVPNTFTPNGDEKNHVFRIYASNIQSFELFIFNRWGELIYTMTSLDDFWDGTYEGLKCQDGTYVWKLNYYDLKGSRYDLTGHINIIR